MKKMYTFTLLISLLFINKVYPMESLKLEIKNGDSEQIRNILSSKPTLIFERDEQNNNWTPLHLASCYCNKPVIELLLTFGAGVLINEPDKLGRTPLHLAAESWAVQNEDSIDDTVVELLLENGAAKSINHLDSFKRAPLFYAAKHKNPAIAQLLLKHGAEKTINQAEIKPRMTPLHHATQWGQIPTIHLLLQKGALKVADTSDACGRIPSEMAAGRENYPAIAAEFNYFKGRYENAPKERLAFFMASHERCSSDSPARFFPLFVFQRICSFIPRIPQD